MTSSYLPGYLRNTPEGEKLKHIIQEIEHKRLPVNNFHRQWILGSSSAKIALGYGLARFRSLFCDTEKQNQIANEAHLKAAIQLFSSMGYLRGAILKIGQTLGNYPDIGIEQFYEVLNALHFNAPPMHYALLQDVFLDEFGQSPQQMFAYFETQAFAAASLGQVHRARLHSGEEVAVKIQYPNIASTIKNDLASLKFYLQALRLPTKFSSQANSERNKKQWADLKIKLADLQHMLLEETDYQKEAQWYQRARKLFPRDSNIIVPKVYQEYSSKRVLTLDYLKGSHLNEFLQQSPSQELRNHYCTLIARATIRLYYQEHSFFTDAHPGNFIFMKGGQLGFIDFGSIREASEEEMQINHQFEQALIEQNHAQMDRHLSMACSSKPDIIDAMDLQLLKQFSLWQMQPWLVEGNFDYGDKQAYQDGINYFAQLVKRGVSSDKTLYLWSMRAVLGGRALGYQLNGQVKLKEIIEQEKQLSKQSKSSFPVQ